MSDIFKHPNTKSRKVLSFDFRKGECFSTPREQLHYLGRRPLVLPTQIVKLPSNECNLKLFSAYRHLMFF